ncbi:hypothetical protein LIZ98_17790, partial [Caldibacillus sp. 210928-DFI.2.18]|uniref:hypothetical protein n=1 Tax=Caldibacillus sp. 210928-DFI.2.18 TaxID=2883264 RepID=UPI001D0765AB
GRDLREPREGEARKEERRGKRDEGQADESGSNKSNIFDAVRGMDIMPAPLEEDVRYSAGQSTEPDCRCPCDHTYSYYKQVSVQNKFSR